MVCSRVVFGFTPEAVWKLVLLGVAASFSWVPFRKKDRMGGVHPEWTGTSSIVRIKSIDGF